MDDVITITGKDVFKVIKHCVPYLKLEDFDDTQAEKINLKRIQNSLHLLEQIEDPTPTQQRYINRLRNSIPRRFFDNYNQPNDDFNDDDPPNDGNMYINASGNYGYNEIIYFCQEWSEKPLRHYILK